MKDFSTNKSSSILNFVFTFILIPILSLFFVVYGQSIPWEKHPNPVLDVGSPGSWDDQIVGAQCVIFANDTFQMWYSGYDGNKFQIGYATSTDGIEWTKDTLHNPVLSPGLSGQWDNFGVLSPEVKLFDDTLHMWYTGIADMDVNYIGHATSLNGFDWIKDTSNPVIVTGSLGSWDSKWIHRPTVIFESDTFHMWYGGGPGTGYSYIGYATATSPYGKSWTKDTLHNPVLSPSLGFWDHTRVEFPNVVTDNNILYMFYSGGSYDNQNIGFATSTDKVNWNKRPEPCLERGTAGEWDDWSIISPYVLYDGVEYKMWYTGWANSSEAKIGLATVDSLITDVKEEFLSPVEFFLSQNFPNPFNPTTIITFGLPVRTHVILKVFNAVGQEVAQLHNGEKEAGRYSFEFNAEGLSSGIYFYRLKTGNYADTKKMILLR